MKTALSIAVALLLYAPGARAEDSSLDAQRAVREALAERALGPVSPPVLPVLLPGPPGEPGHGRGTQPQPAPAPRPAPGKPGIPAPGSKPPDGGNHGSTHHEGPGGVMSRSAQSEAVGIGAREAHRIRADAANRAAAGAAASGASSTAAHASSDCQDAASTMRSIGMDPEHPGSPHHGGMTPHP